MRPLLMVVALTLTVSPALAQLAVPNDAGLSYGHIHLNVTDIDLHKRLWVEHFGGVVVDRGPLNAIRLPNLLVLLSDRAPTGGSEGSVVNHFGFKVRNLEKFLSRWRSAGYAVHSEFTGSEGQPNAYVVMPDDVLVELQEDQGLSVEVAGYHVHLFTAEYEALLDWYVDVFGLERRPRGRIQTTTNVPGMNISFGELRVGDAASRGRAIDHIGFELDDLEAFCEQLRARGIEFDVEFREVESIQVKIAFITDPAGTYIELTEGLDAF